jgi:serine/threonine-protein kinase
MEFRILGSLEVVGDDGALALGGPKQRAVLAHLILRANRPVPASELIDGLWGEEPPETARNTLQTYVYRLRKALGEERIEAGSGGYVLRTSPGEVDAERFQALVKRAKGELESAPETALAHLDEALGMWRGPALADFTEEPSLRGDVARLDELRLAALEHRASAELRLGRHSTVITDLEELTVRHPLRERLWASLILALYRSGRQAEALSTYERAREVLANELGVDPSPELQELHRRILGQDPSLSPRPASDPVSGSRAARGDLEPGAEFAGHRIERIIGRGGMGVVYLAHHEGLQRKVALKLLAPQLAEDQSFRDRFVRESRLAASIDHPNVLPIFEAGESDDRLYISMRFVEGTDLRAMLREGGPLDASEASRITEQVAAALDAAHEEGLVHRDVKPANVLIARRRGTEGGTHAYLTDFGLTKRAASDSGATGTGQFVGTLDYAAPEQFRGDPADARTDVYSLGCVLFECLAGHPPFRAENDAAVMYGHLMDDRPRVSAERTDLPADLDDVVATAMAKEPGERYPSAGAFASAVVAALGFESGSQPTAGRPRAGPPAGGPARRRRRVVIGAIAAALALALVIGLLQVVGGEPARASFDPGVAIVDETTGEPLVSIPTSEIRQPERIIHSGGSFWVHNLDPNSFVEIDARTGRVVSQVAAPFQDVGRFTVDGDTLWVTGPYVSKIDVGLRREVDRFELPGPSLGVVVAEGSLWVTIPDGNMTVRLDPETGEVTHAFTELPGSQELASGDGSIWALGWVAPFGIPLGGVNRIDPDSNTVAKSSVPMLPPDCCAVVAGGGFGWTADPTKGVLYKLDEAGGVAATYVAGQGATVGAFDVGTVWVGNSDIGTVSGFDALTGARRTVRFDRPIQGVAAGSGVLAVALGPGRTYEDVIDGLRGTVARFVVPPGILTSLDPATTAGFLGFWMESATCARLIRYADDPSDEGILEPEVAAAMPEVSPDGLTYTFTIRPGYRFSPPSNEELTAETFRYSIERALSNDVDSSGRFSLFDIEGFGAYRRGAAPHLSGLEADGDTLTIRLSQPASDFVARLALPWFCPVPLGTPLVPGGAGADARYPHRAPITVPSAGPYFVADHLEGEYVILRRNPNYAGPRSATFDAIALREGVDTGIAVRSVESGDWDGITHVNDSLLAPAGPVAGRHQLGNASAGSPTYLAAPMPITGFFAFNTSTAPFDDPDIRRAAALAIDREALAALWRNLPSDQILPPNMPGFEDADLFPLGGSGLDEARALMDGRTVTAVIGVPEGIEQQRQEAELVRSYLAPIGIDVVFRDVPAETLFGFPPRLPREVDLFGVGLEQSFPDAATFVSTVLCCRVPAGWVSDALSEQAFAVFDLSVEEQAAAAAELADRLVSDEVALAVDLYGAAPAFLGGSLACARFPPFGYGVDLTALCPR